jgi:hypothetical protein
MDYSIGSDVTSRRETPHSVRKRLTQCRILLANGAIVSLRWMFLQLGSDNIKKLSFSTALWKAHQCTPLPMKRHHIYYTVT